MSKVYVAMTDTFLSGWGAAKDQTNRLVVECDSMEQAETIERNARKRSEMKRVSICLNVPKSRPGVLLTWKTWDDLSGPWKA